ncbi:hypothetical protein IFM89_031287 [Coptis chinensis]|uniref:60S ribosomal protein L34 n=1 Tax=Coptis chinensis TaxID=261450 RepID=A0A835IYK3_9MAGN|nr:hypothetical protein IFM89_031287 [Coptis chinensis]
MRRVDDDDDEGDFEDDKDAELLEKLSAIDKNLEDKLALLDHTFGRKGRALEEEIKDLNDPILFALPGSPPWLMVEDKADVIVVVGASAFVARCTVVPFVHLILSLSNPFQNFGKVPQIPHLRPAEYKRSRLSRNRRTVNRAYGGVLSGSAVRERIIRTFLVEEQKIVKKVLKIEKAKEKFE